MSDFPGPQKNKIEFFVHHLYEGKGGKKLSKEEIRQAASRFQFAPDVEVFFKEIPEGSYSEDELIDQLNRVITSRGREQAIGGTLHKLTHVPPEWQHAYEQYYQH